MPKYRNCPACSAEFQLKHGSRRLCVHCASARERANAALRIAVAKAIQDGVLVREPCEVCGNPKVDGHHDDYSKPLDVRWLCRSHHRLHHNKQWRDATASQTEVL
mgnify:CR=1 FL=1